MDRGRADPKRHFLAKLLQIDDHSCLPGEQSRQGTPFLHESRLFRKRSIVGYVSIPSIRRQWTARRVSDSRRNHSPGQMMLALGRTFESSRVSSLNLSTPSPQDRLGSPSDALQGRQRQKLLKVSSWLPARMMRMGSEFNQVLDSDMTQSKQRDCR